MKTLSLAPPPFRPQALARTPVAEAPRANPATPSRGAHAWASATHMGLAPLVVLLPWAASPLVERLSQPVNDLPAVAQAVAMLVLVLAKGFPMAYGLSFWQSMRARTQQAPAAQILGWSLGFLGAWLALLSACLATLWACVWACVRLSQVLL